MKSKKSYTIWRDCMNQKYRNKLKQKKRIVVKIGSSSLAHPETGHLDLNKIEVLVRELSDLVNQNKEVVLVSSGAIMVGSKTLGFSKKPQELALKQACASIGQARLMMIYQKLFSEYNQIASQILMTNFTIQNPNSKKNARNTLNALLSLGMIPIVNENDTVATEEIEVGDNDTLSAMVASLIDAELLILLSDIDGLFTDDPHQNKEAKLIEFVDSIDSEVLSMAKESTGSNVGTGGMATKLCAARICMEKGCDMLIANGCDFHILHDLMEGKNAGTLFTKGEEQ